MEVDDDGSQGSDKNVPVIETATGKILTGEDAPLLSQLQQWLEAHPGWDVYDSDDDDEDDDEGKGNIYFFSVLSFAILFISLSCKSDITDTIF